MSTSPIIFSTGLSINTTKLLLLSISLFMEVFITPPPVEIMLFLFLESSLQASVSHFLNTSSPSLNNSWTSFPDISTIYLSIS